MAASARRPGSVGAFDVPSILLAPLGLIVVIVAQSADGLAARTLVNGSAALIVFGGTLGAVLVSYSPRELVRAARAALDAFRRRDDDTAALGATLVAMAGRAHRVGLMAMEPEIDALGDPFLREGLELVVDDTPADLVEQFLAAERDARAAEDDAPARLFESAAGYAPTLGILGAVLGLIRVMQTIGATPSFGTGIGSAFVATVYGVGLANLVLLPIAGRLRERASVAARRREIVVQGIRAIQKRTHPRLVARGLRSTTGEVGRVEDLTVVTPPRGIRRPAVRMPGTPA